MNHDSSARVLRFAVTGALLVGASGCTDPKTYSNPGPVNPPPSASPSQASSPTPATSPAPNASPLASQTPPMLTNPGPDERH